MKVNKIIVDELPDSCYTCIFSNAEYDNITCLITGKTQKDYTGFKRMRTCKLKKETNVYKKTRGDEND